MISIHAPSEGSDTITIAAMPTTAGFQFTLPVKGATGMGAVYLTGMTDFNPRSQ